jgi:hypothetical protein
MVSFVKLPVIDFDNVEHNDQLKKPCGSVDAEVAPEGLHNPNTSERADESSPKKRPKLRGELDRKGISAHR